jgi:hypothetical protein
MEQHIKDIVAVVGKDATWMTQKLVIKIDEVTTFDIVLYLSGGPKLDENLSFSNPLLMTQNELIGVFKREAASQGVHLTQSASLSNVDSRGSHFFQTSMRSLPTLLPNRQHGQEEDRV